MLFSTDENTTPVTTIKSKTSLIYVKHDNPSVDH